MVRCDLAGRRLSTIRTRFCVCIVGRSRQDSRLITDFKVFDSIRFDFILFCLILCCDRRPMHPVEDVATGIWLRSAVGESQLARLHADSSLFPLIKTGDTIGVCYATMIVRRHCDEPELMHRLYDNIRKCNDDICCGANEL